MFVCEEEDSGQGDNAELRSTWGVGLLLCVLETPKPILQDMQSVAQERDNGIREVSMYMRINYLLQ